MSTQNSSTYQIATWLFLKVMGVIYLIAFLSLSVQVLGLIGSHGINPLADLVPMAKAQLGGANFWRFPTFFWLLTSDNFILLLSYGGAALSILYIFGVMPGPLSLLLWATYLSFVTVSAPFLNFQWDNLLLEVGFVTIFLSPWKFWATRPSQNPPSKIILYLVWFLLFKLTFSSGLVKLASGGETWKNLTALNFHYETQPLPHFLSWFAHQLPQWFQKISVVSMFFIELVVPLFIFSPRKIRQVAGFLLIGLQLIIFFTGNYGFFNLITLALCLTLYDDTFFSRFSLSRRSHSYRFHHSWVFRIAASLLLVIFITVSLSQMSRRLARYGLISQPVRFLLQTLAPFRTINGYGLFAVMTTKRPEIVIEGSEDGQEWKAYEFKWKPGDLSTAPKWVQPHMPRLDWQMWFAALGNARRNPWLIRFMEHLLLGTPEPLSLLKHNPFPNKPPKYVRAQLYDYHFTNGEEKKQTDHWWKRTFLRPYTPVMSLKKE